MNSGKTIINHLVVNREEIQKILNRVDRIVESEEVLLSSLCLGKLSKVIYWAIRYKQSNKHQYYKLCINNLEAIINNLGSQNLDFTLGNGVAGICWTIKVLIKLEILKKRGLEYIRGCSSLFKGFHNYRY